MTTATFIGLGVMGYPMAGHLANAGFTVRVWNRSEQKSLQWAKEYPGTACQTIAEAADGADFVLTCVGADKDLIAVYEGEDGILAHAQPGAILVDHTTASAGSPRGWQKHRARPVWVLLTHRSQGGSRGRRMA